MERDFLKELLYANTETMANLVVTSLNGLVHNCPCPFGLSLPLKALSVVPPGINRCFLNYRYIIFFHFVYVFPL